MSNKPSDHQQDSYTAMQTFTKNNFYLFPVIKYDYNGDDGHIIAVANEVFSGKLSQAIDYTQGKALNAKKRQMSLLNVMFLATALSLFGFFAGGVMLGVTGIAVVTSAWAILLFAKTEHRSKRMQQSFRSLRSLDKHADTTQIVSINDIQDFNCPLDVSEHLKEFNPKAWDEVKLGRFYAPQDMFSMVALIALSSPYTHKDAVSMMQDMIFATKEEKLQIANELCEMIMKKPEDFHD